MSNQQVGVCGLACFKCPKYKSGDCNGCEPNEVCPLPACAEEKGVEMCFDCEKFPCEKNYEAGPIAGELLDFWAGKE